MGSIYFIADKYIEKNGLVFQTAQVFVSQVRLMKTYQYSQIWVWNRIQWNQILQKAANGHHKSLKKRETSLMEIFRSKSIIKMKNERMEKP